MKNILSASCKQTIHEYAGQAEQLGCLPPALLQLAYTNNWFKLFVPEVYGGPGLLLPEILRLEEAIASEDGSLGWTVTLCSGAGWFAGFLDPKLADEVFADPQVCFAGSGAVGGTAIKDGDGYLVNGTWKYASGATHATIFTANCVLQDTDRNNLTDDRGEPLIKSFILKKDEVEIIPGWSYFGLVATGSHAFTVKNLKVPLNRTFEINAGIKVRSTGFDYPFLQLAETTLAVNSLGMASHFISLTAAAFAERSGQKRYTEEQVLFFNEELERSTATLEQVRAGFYAAFDQSWEQLVQDGSIMNEQLESVSKISRQLAHTSRRIADSLFPFAGLEAAKKETEINRVWRDIHTASQHSLLTFE